MAEQVPRMTTAELITAAIDIGELLQESGAEIYRVEESMQRLCFAYGARDAHVYAVPTNIIITAAREGEVPITRSRRIHARGTNLDRLDALNALCRELCREPRDYAEVQRRLAEIRSRPLFGIWALRLGASGIGGFFTLLFGGTFLAAVWAAAVCFFVRWVLDAMNRLQVSTLFCNIVGGAMIGAAALLGQLARLYGSYDKMIIGSIMTLVPGVMITNSIRDLIAGDSISGMTRFTEALLVAIGIAIGVAIPLAMYHGFGGGWR